MNDKEHSEEFRQVIAKTWADDDFKRRLLTDPVCALGVEGIDIPAGLEVRVVENTDRVFYLVLPAKPADQWKRSRLWIKPISE
jgi:hypothetical protein